MQLWTAGVGVSAGFHNHLGEPFCEIHACIVNGTGKGGMHWATVPDGDFDPSKPEAGKTDSVVVPDMYEHGPLWRTRRDGLPSLRDNGTVDYPWHGKIHIYPISRVPELTLDSLDRGWKIRVFSTIIRRMGRL